MTQKHEYESPDSILVTAEIADPKPGLKTTEFWATVGAALLTVAVGGGWLTAGESQDIVGATAQTYAALAHLVTALAPLAASIVYTWSRTRVKTQS